MVATVTAPGVPDMAADVPTEAFEPVATTILLPAVLRTTLPFVAVIFPKVAVIDVAADMEVPACRVVVDAIDPGATKVAGIDHVIVLPEPVVVIWFAVPKTLILPAEGEIAPPESPVSVSTFPGVIAMTFQVAVPPASATRI